MKRTILILLAAMLLVPMTMEGQTYNALWKQVQEAQDKDLPQTAIGHLKTIAKRADKEKAYGQLLKATLLEARLQAEIAPDSLQPAVARLEREAEATRDEALKAVYYTVLTKIHERNADQLTPLSEKFSPLSLNLDLLAHTKATAYVPFVIKGADSKEYFANDLLSVIGQELEQWRWLHDYYTKAGNRRAACITGAYAFNDVAALDSLAEQYGDLPEAGEIAIKRYQTMQGTTAERITYLRTALKRWGSWRRASWLRSEEEGLTRPKFSAQMPLRVATPEEEQTIKVNGIRNVESLTMRVFRTNLKGDTSLDPDDSDNYKKIKQGMTELSQLARTLHYAIAENPTATAHGNYELFDDSITLGGLPAGIYLVEFSSPQTATSRELYFVSGVRMMREAMPQEQMRYVVVDARSGQPLPNAKLRLKYHRGESHTKLLTCDAQGEAIVSTAERTPSEAWATNGDDSFCPPTGGYGRYSYYNRVYNAEHFDLFTDRAIYRPGQTVHVAAILWRELSETENGAMADKEVKIELRDANYKLVAEQTVTTDRYGKCATQFTLPTGKLNGRFTLHADRISTSIRVEEYKRPTFQVEFPEYKESYQAGDTINIKANALTYSGVPVQGAQVHYTVKRRVAFWWLSYSHYWQDGYFGHGRSEELLTEGDTTTGDDGTFTVAMPLLLPDDAKDVPMYYHFVVEADVTDQGGETHNATMALPLGTKATALTCDLPQKVRRDQIPPITFSRRNAAGQEIAGTVRYRIDNGKWKETEANAQCTMDNAQLKSGQHRLEAICETDTIDTSFVVFSLDDTTPAIDTRDWFYVSDSRFPADGSPVTLQVGSSDPDLHIVYGLYAGDKVIESGVVKKSRALLNRKLTYKEEYGNGLLLTFAWVKDGKCYEHHQTIGRPLPDKKLRLQWITFRDRLTPGQQEQWTLTIKKPDGKAADASMMAVLYDKSLDQLQEHGWSFAPSNYLPTPSTAWQFRTWRELYWSASKPWNNHHDIDELAFSHFDSSVYPYHYDHIYVRGAHPMLMAKNARVEAMAADGVEELSVSRYAGDALEAPAAAGTMADDEKAQQESQTSQEPTTPSLRENLQETAFFLPNLVTDKDGTVRLRFTLPESLTTWRCIAVANSADMLYGSIEGEAVASKDVMVQPNMPRFLRQGDEAQITARIFNTADHAINGTARMQLLDPESEAVVYEQQLAFSTEAGKTTAVTFNAQCSMHNAQLLICRIIASGEGFSDGEQHYLPILPDEEYVTKTVPITQHEAGVKTIDLTTLFTSTKNAKLTIEYTNNPAWLMVQALPTIGQPREYSAIDHAASYYSNLLAKTLIDQSPQVKSVFRQWQQEESNHTAQNTTLSSQLEKNEELKDLLLDETPWMVAADRENEQRHRIADFFDENGISNRLDTAIEKLKALQNGDGSFSWYPGMEGSEHITISVCEMLVRLKTMTTTPMPESLYDRAYSYMGSEMVKLVEELKKYEKKGHDVSFPSFNALRWLYVCALDGRTPDNDVKKANDYLINLMKKDIKRQSIYEKALSAVIFAKNGDTKRAKEYAQSIKEYTVFTEEMGRYYDTPRAGYSWYDYRIPTEVAAIEALQTITPDDQQTTDEMRRWLLQEKRTQAWDTPINSVNAIYAFLGKSGQNSLSTQTTPTTFAIDGTALDMPKATAGIGYVKTAISAPKGSTLAITKTSEGTSWGAVYAQFTQKTTDIEASQSGITIKREIMTGISGTSGIAVGDRIKVRITLETSRDLDFVQVVDRRAACMEPVRQLSGYHNGAYVSPKDNATHYFYHGLAKGRHVIETEYYIDRAGQYDTGTCTIQCAYAPEYRATAPAITLNVKE